MKMQSVFLISLVVLCTFAPRLGVSQTASLLRTRALKDENSEESAIAPTEEDVCIPEDNLWRPGETYNDASALITSTAVECCDICQADERCITWSRDRRTGACALKDFSLLTLFDENYDSGLIESRDPGIVADTDASYLAAIRRCFREPGIAYPGGNVLMTRQTGSIDECCELCRDDRDCYSWHRNGGTGRCVMNRNIPGSVHRGSSFAGGAMV